MLKILNLLFLNIVFLYSIELKYQQEIHNAVRNNDIEMLKYILKNSSQFINEIDDMGYTPLHLAVRKDDISMVKYILSFNANTNTQDKFGDTPLIDSARNNNMEIVKLLICKGADKNIKNKRNQAPLDFISDKKQYETALFLQNHTCIDDIEKEKKNLIERLRKLE